jgi:hypothetical protein
MRNWGKDAGARSSVSRGFHDRLAADEPRELA